MVSEETHSDTISRSTLGLALLFWLLGIIAAASASFYLSRSRLPDQFIWIPPFVLLLLWLTGWRILKDKLVGRTWITPANGFLALIFLYFGHGSVRYLLTFDSINPAILKNPEWTNEAILLVIAGTLAFLAGARLPWFGFLGNKASQNIGDGWKPRYTVGVICSLAITLGAQSYLISVEHFGVGALGAFRAIYSIISQFSVAGFLGLSLVSFGYSRRNWKVPKFVKLVALVSIAILFLFAASTTSKRAVIELGLYLLIPYLYGSRRIHFGMLVAGAGFILLIFAFFPLLRANLFEANRTRSAGRLNRAAYAVEESIESQEYQNLFSKGIDSLSSRVSMFNWLFPVLERVPTYYDYRGFERYPYLVGTPFIPRVLWPSKPKLNQGKSFTRRFINPNAQNSTTPTTFGWAYMEAGYVSVILLLFILGLSARLLEKLFLEKWYGTVLGILGITAYTLFFLDIESDPFWRINSLLKFTIVFVFSYWLLTGLPQLASSEMQKV